jgi:hypothetical protein
MVQHGVADGADVRPVRAHRHIAPRAEVLFSRAGFAEIVETLRMLRLCPARAIAEERGPARSIDSLH